MNGYAANQIRYFAEERQAQLLATAASLRAEQDARAAYEKVLAQGGEIPFLTNEGEWIKIRVALSSCVILGVPRIKRAA